MNSPLLVTTEKALKPEHISAVGAAHDDRQPAPSVKIIIPGYQPFT
jgi:hypothetical protein